MFKRFLALAAVLTALFSLCSCGMTSSDVQLYVKGNLDVVYLNHADEDYMELTQVTKEQCEQDYERGIMQETEYFMSYVQIEDVSAQTVERISQLLRDIYAYSKYEVGDVTRSKNKYLISVTIYPIDIMVNAYDNGMQTYSQDFSRRADAGEFDVMSDREREEQWAQGMISAVEAELDNIGYLDPVTLYIQVSREGDYYTINEDDFVRVDELIIRY